MQQYLSVFKRPEQGPEWLSKLVTCCNVGWNWKELNTWTFAYFCRWGGVRGHKTWGRDATKKAHQVSWLKKCCDKGEITLRFQWNSGNWALHYFRLGLGVWYRQSCDVILRMKGLCFSSLYLYVTKSSTHQKYPTQPLNCKRLMIRPR